MLHSIYSYLISFYYTKFPNTSIETQIIKEKEITDKKTYQIEAHNYLYHDTENFHIQEIDEKSIRNNDFKQKQEKIRKNKNNFRTKNKH